MNGILVVDKPIGLTSHDIVQQVRRRLQIRRVGHAGTLDPLASGVLVLGIGQGTRLLEFLSAAQKSYRAEVHLGVVSATLDGEGPLQAQPVAQWPSQDDVQLVVSALRGSLQQVPPAHSAIHLQGQRAYDLARQGQVVALPPRPIHIYKHEIVSYHAPRLVVDLTVSKGTYIRSLARDIGAQLKTGGYLAALRRTASGQFTLEQAVNWAEWLASSQPESYGQSLKLATDQMFTFPVDRQQIDDLQHGRAVYYPTAPESTVGRVIDQDQLIAIVKWHDQVLQSMKVLTNAA